MRKWYQFNKEPIPIRLEFNSVIPFCKTIIVEKKYLVEMSMEFLRFFRGNGLIPRSDAEYKMHDKSCHN